MLTDTNSIVGPEFPLLIDFLIPPQTPDYGAAGNVVLMEYLGDRAAPAPRLSELRMTPSEAEEAWRQSFEILRHFARLGKVHGDYSTYNLLWYRERVVAIDFPQMVEAHESPRALELLRRDLESLCRSFRRLGVRQDPSDLWRGVVGRAAELARPTTRFGSR